MKKVVKISVAAVVLAIVAVASFVVIREKSMPIKAEEVIANLEWGMTSQEAKRYESSCIESISEEYHEDRLLTDPDYARYFVGEESLVFVSRSPERLDVRFEDSSSQEMKALIGALKLLDATDAPSPSRYFSKRGE